MKIFFISIFFLTISLSLFGQSGLSDSLKIQSKLDDKRLSDIERLDEYVQDFLIKYEQGENPEFNWFRRVSNNWGVHREMNKYTDDLLEPLSIDYILNYRKMEVLALMPLPQKTRDSILNYGDTPLYIKARLGDSIAEMKIIREFDSLVVMNVNDDFRKKRLRLRQLAHELMYIDSDKSINTLVTALETPLVYDLKNGIVVSRFGELLYAYKSFNQYEFEVSFYYPRFLVGLKNKTDEMQKYFELLEAYFKRKHNQIIVIQAPFLGYGRAELQE